MNFLRSASLLLTAIFLMSCGPSQEVTRMNPNSQTDLSGKWNDTDAKRVAEKMTSNILAGGWLQNAEEPVLIVGNINNNTAEHINTGLFIREIEKAIVNNPNVEMVADAEQRKQIRQERMDQQKHASFESAASVAKELGANYMLVGNIDANVEKNLDGTQAAKFYDVTLELIDVEQNRKVWIEDKEIKKLIERDKVKW
jgi:uncharacterized protein (TIGR02722 family)